MNLDSASSLSCSMCKKRYAEEVEGAIAFFTDPLDRSEYSMAPLEYGTLQLKLREPSILKFDLPASYFSLPFLHFN